MRTDVSSHEGLPCIREGFLVGGRRATYRHAHADGRAERRADPGRARHAAWASVLRRYWYPVAFTRELAEFPVKRVRAARRVLRALAPAVGPLRDRPGAVPAPEGVDGLRRGRVRRAALPVPRLEVRHRRRVHRPARRARRDQLRATGCGPPPGKVEELGGLIWAYVGPDPAPQLPRFDTYVMDGYRDIGWADLPCNYVQIMENAVDPHHVEWLHGRYFEFMGRHEGFTRPRRSARSTSRSASRRSSGGSSSAGCSRGATEENDDWKVGHPLVFPYNMRVGGGGRAPDADPGADQPDHHPVHALHGAQPGRLRARRPAADPRLPDPGDRRERPARHQLRRGPGHHGVGDAGRDHRPHHRAPGPLRHRRRRCCARCSASRWTRSRSGEDPLGTIREPHERIDLPCEKDKFNAGGAQFALDFCDMGSTRFSPVLDTIKKIHISAAEKIASGR